MYEKKTDNEIVIFLHIYIKFEIVNDFHWEEKKIGIVTWKHERPERISFGLNTF